MKISLAEGWSYELPPSQSLPTRGEGIISNAAFCNECQKFYENKFGRGMEL